MEAQDFMHGLKTNHHEDGGSDSHKMHCQSCAEYGCRICGESNRLQLMLALGDAKSTRQTLPGLVTCEIHERINLPLVSCSQRIEVICTQRAADNK